MGRSPEMRQGTGRQRRWSDEHLFWLIVSGAVAWGVAGLWALAALLPVPTPAWCTAGVVVGLLVLHALVWVVVELQRLRIQLGRAER